MTPGELADKVERMIRGLPTEADRAKARLILKRRLNHPEVGAYPEHAENGTSRGIHPKSGGRQAAHEGGPLCARCGWSRRAHDIDGESAQCDGYVAAP